VIDQIFILIKALGEPEYLYLLMEPAFIWGVGIGLLVFLGGFVLSDTQSQTLGLLVIILSALLIVPYLKFRGDAAPRIAKIYEFDRPATATEFKKQSSRYQDTRWAYLGLGGVAGAVLLVGARNNRVGFTLSLATVVGAIGVVLFSLSMHLKDSQIHHPNLLAIKQATVWGEEPPPNLAPAPPQ
jgi:hypothetical protein